MRNAILPVMLALVLMGGGCVKESAPARVYDVTPEQRDTCSRMASLTSLDFAHAPEDKDGPERTYRSLRDQCLESMELGRTYHAVKMPHGPGGEGVADAERGALDDVFYVYSLCENEVRYWTNDAGKSDRAVVGECRTNCVEGDDGAVTCEETVYTAGPFTDIKPMVGGDRDEHGCIGSAGYMWCAPKEKCLRIWEEQCYADLSQEVAYFLAEKYDRPIGEVNVTVTAQESDHASGGVRFGEDGFGEGGVWLARRQGNMWEVVFDGNGSVDCGTMRSEFGFPDSILRPDFCD